MTAIDPKDIRRGDKVRCTSTSSVFEVTKNIGGWIHGDIDDIDSAIGHEQPSERWTLSWELVERPQPKPEVGQHWLDDNGAECVVIDRDGVLLFVPLRHGRRTERAVNDAVPDGWTLKP